jgi:hypothetical protein
MITRKNYEEYFLDYFDGNLSDEEVERLLRFLAANPDLEEEFYLLMEQTADCNITFEDFSSIMVKRNPKIGYQLTSFDYLCVAELEQDITPSEKVILEGSIAANAKLRADFDIFQKTKLAEENIECPFKDELKKNVFNSQLKRNLITYSSIAAAVLLVFYFTVNEEQVRELSRNTEPKIEVVPQNTNNAIRQIVTRPVVAEQMVDQGKYKEEHKVPSPKIVLDNGINMNSIEQIQHVETNTSLRQETQISRIESNSSIRVEGGDVAVNSLTQISQHEPFQQINDNNSVNSGLASNVNIFLEKAKIESESISQKIKDIKGRRKGVFIARAINGINTILGTSIEYSSKYNAEGELVAMNLEAGYLKYSKKNDENK